MARLTQPGVWPRRMLLRHALGGVALLPAGPRIAAAEDASKAAVTIDNFVFQPKTVRVKQGRTVTWHNHDDIPHSIVLPRLKVHSPPIDTDGVFAFRFEQAGVYDYVCGLHPFMKGQVVVTP